MRERAFKRAVAAILLAAFISALPGSVLAVNVDLAGMDRSVVPGDDFFLYTNGTWYKDAVIPPDRSSLGTFQTIAAEVARRNASLIADAEKEKTPEAQMVADYYAAYIDEKAIEAKGLKPIADELAQIAAIKDKTGLARVLGSQMRADVDPLNMTNFYTNRLFGLWVSADLNDPKRNVPYLLQGGLGLPDRDYYFDESKDGVALKEKYREHLGNVLRLAKVADPEAKARRIYDLENKIAATHASREESADVSKANNPWKTADLSKQAPGLDWKEYFRAAGLGTVPKIIVWHPNAVKGISALTASEPLDTWKEYLTLRVIDRYANLLPKAFADENFAFYGKELGGVSVQGSRRGRGINATSDALGDVVAKMYVEKYFSPQAKAAIQQLVENIRKAFRLRIDKLDWMTPETREKAKAKVDTLYVGVGYPDKWRSYNGLKIDRFDAVGNDRRVSLFDYKYALSKLNHPVDQSEWWITAQTVNALNLPLQNALNFPAAILLPPFFDPEADPVVNYGAIGTIIGHEISHSFDATGSLFDAYGRLSNWWTPADLAHFQDAGKRLAAQYDSYEALPGLFLKGRQLLDENIADLAGLSAAYDGYRAAYGGKEAPTVSDLTGDQQFFVAFGQAFRGKMREQLLRMLITTDSHSPDRWRTYTVRNVDAWYRAFDVKPGQKLYLDPKDRVKVW
ncbi:MAG: M13 family metallopeptidase [Acidobacteria bacterium]|nr:M13 family metallopeptidase [Acidobacteriota bacterium]